MRGRDTIAFARQVLLDQIADLTLIIDDQNVTVIMLTRQLRLPFLRSVPDDRSIAKDIRSGTLPLAHTYGYKFLHKTDRSDIIG